MGVNNSYLDFSNSLCAERTKPLWTDFGFRSPDEEVDVRRPEETESEFLKRRAWDLCGIERVLPVSELLLDLVDEHDEVEPSPSSFDNGAAA